MKFVIVFIITLLGATTQAQEIMNFKLTNARDGKEVSLSDYASFKAIVVVFTSHECPFDNYYKDRLKELTRTYSGSVQFILINANLEEQESADQMAIHYTDLAVPYLADKNQQVMTNFNAKKTPEAFLITSSGGKFSVAYHGAIDDNPQASQDVRQYYLKDAIDYVLSGKKIDISSQRVTGCTIRK
jgi:peroxiredoxin